MFESLSFVLKLQDLLTPGLRQAANVSNTSAAQIESRFEKISRSGRKMSASVNELRDRLDSVNKVRFGTTIEREFNIATRAANRLEKEIERLENKGKGGGGGMFGNIVKGNLVASAIQRGFGMVQNGFGDVYSTALSNSSLTTAINSTTGGQGKQAVAETSRISSKYGLNYQASLEGVKTLTGGLKSMNLPLEEQMRIFEGVSTGIAAMKLSADESKGAMLALGQMASKGTVSAEELRGQLGERIPGAFGIAAKAMRVTEAELGKMLQKGEIAAKDFLPRFATEMQKTFGADALAAAKGPQAIQERFNNALYNLKVTIGEGILPLITPLLEKLTVIATSVLPWIQTTMQSIAGFFSGTSESSSKWAGYLEPIKTVLNVIWVTVKSLAANIYNVIGGVIEWASKSEILKDVAWGIGKAFEGVGWLIRQIGDAIEWMWKNTIKPILDAAEWVYSKVKGVFGGKTTVEVVAAQAPVVPMRNVYEDAMRADDTKRQRPVWEAAMLADDKRRKAGGSTSLTGEMKDAKAKSESINNGGQRSIVINIGKQIEKLEQHIIGGGKEAADEIEIAVRETMRRVVYSINAVAS